MLVLLFRLLSFLPLPVLHAIGIALGWTVYLSSSRYRRRLKENILQAGFGNHLHAAIAESGKNMMELPFVWCASPQRVLKSVRVENWHLVQDAQAAQRPVIFLTPHLGCFEIAAQAAAARTPLTVMYRPPRQQALKPLVEGARARQNLSLAPATLSGVRTLFKVLKRKGIIGLLPDQVPQNGEGVWADFFGSPAYTMTLPARMQEMTEAATVLAFAERLPRGKGYILHFQDFSMPPGLTAQQQARAVNAAMEDLIRQRPSQYFWSYNRYKVPSGVTAPDHATQAGEI